VEAFHRGTGQVKRVATPTAASVYRDSVFKADLETWTITAVEFRLPRRRDCAWTTPACARKLLAMGVETPRPSHVAEAIRPHPHAQAAQPGADRQCRQLFQNPAAARGASRSLARADSPELPVFGSVCRCAQALRRLADRAGRLEGLPRGRRRHQRAARAGAGQPRPRHRRAAAGARAPRGDSVREKFGVALEPEPRIIGARWDA
jgi:UDP-N-acetylmuramate dehydrogenase